MSTQTEKIIKIKTWLPVFPGFYNTLFDINESLGMFEEGIKKAGLVDKDFNLDWDNSSFEREVLQQCCKWVSKQLPKESGVFRIRLEEVVSPKEYNFTNDSANIEIELDIEKFSAWFSEYINGKFIFEKSKEVREALNNISNEDKKILMLDNGDEGFWEKPSNKEEWQEYLRRHYESRSGFISFYPSDAETWAELTNNYRFDEKLDEGKYYKHEKIINGVHSLGRCLEFYLENEDDEAEYLMYYYCCERVYMDNYIKNLPDTITSEVLDERNIEVLRF